MSNSAYRMLAGAAALTVFALVQPASALTMKQCSEKYKSANEAGNIVSKNWNDFRKAECGEGATMALTTAKKKEPKTAAKEPKTEKAAKKESMAAVEGPSMQECSANYKAAKDAGTLGGMTWNEFRKSGCIAKTAAEPVTKKKTKKESAQVPPLDKTTVSQQECSDRYQAAKSSDSLGGMTWNEFRKAGCPTTIAKKSGSMMPTMGTIFPSGIAKKYARQPAGKARMLTCRDQYRANKAAGMTEPKWTEEGGGYYSECNKRLSQQ